MGGSDIDIRHLVALIAIADEGSFSKAATALGFTQSAVSQQIAALEKAVGLTVFDRPRGPHAASLTPVGALILEHARTVLAQFHLMDGELDRLRRGITGKLMIGTFQSVSAEILPAIVGRMQAEFPEVDIRLFETDSQAILVRGVLADELDLSFTVDAEADARLLSTVLGYDPFVVVAQRADLNGLVALPADLHEQALVGQPESNVCQALVDQRLAKIGVQPRYVFRSVDNGAVQGMVRAGMGRAVMPYLAVDAGDPDIVVLGIDPPIPPRTVQLIRRSGKHLPPAADRFEEIALDVGAATLQRDSFSSRDADA